MKKNADKGKVAGWILIIAGIIIGWSPFRFFPDELEKIPQTVPLQI